MKALNCPHSTRINLRILVLCVPPGLMLPAQAAELDWLKPSDMALESGATLMLDYANIDDIPRRGEKAADWLLRRSTVQGRLALNEVFTVEAELAFDDEDNRWFWRDAFVDINLPDKWRVRLGRQKQSFGMLHTASLRNSLSMERPQALDMLALPRSEGIVVNRKFDTGLLEASWFRHEEDGVAVDSYLSRAVYIRDEERYWHTALSMSVSDYDGAAYRVDSGVQTSLLDNALRTEKITAERVSHGGLNAAWRRGRAALLGEGIYTRVDSLREGDREYAGALLQGSWFLTADQHRFDGGALRSLRPASGVAAELVATYGWLDAFSRHDGFVSSTATLGLNVYVGDHLKLMAEVGRLQIQQGDDRGEQGSLAQVRVQLRF